jgi:hypothetical protein
LSTSVGRGATAVAVLATTPAARRVARADVGLNAHDRITNGFGAKFCGDDSATHCERLPHYPRRRAAAR